jgi:hypothetical protein
MNKSKGAGGRLPPKNNPCISPSRLVFLKILFHNVQGITTLFFCGLTLAGVVVALVKSHAQACVAAPIHCASNILPLPRVTADVPAKSRGQLSGRPQAAARLFISILLSSHGNDREIAAIDEQLKALQPSF